MDHRRRWIPLLAAAAALGAVALGSFLASGTPDAPEPPPVEDGPAPPRPPAGFPDLVLPKDLPEDAGKALRRAWEVAVTSGPAETAAALESLVPSGKPGPLDASAPRALEAFAPVLEHLVREGGDPVPAAALRVAAALARRGGAEGRAALNRSGLVSRAFSVQAVAGPVETRLQAVWLLGIAGTPEAARWLVVILDGAPEPAVRERAVDALAQVHAGGTRLPPEAVAAIRKALGASAGLPGLRRSCLAAIRAAWKDVEPYLQDGEFRETLASTLDDPDRSVRLDAARFFEDHPLSESGPALVRLASDADEAVVGAAAGALGEVRPPGAREALEKRLPAIRDPAVRKAVERAIRMCGGT